MKALFKSVNLIGDALYISEPLRAWYQQHPDAEITILTVDDYIAPLYRGMGVPCEVVFAANESDYDFVFDFNVNQAFIIGHKEQCHISEAYAKMLGVEIAVAGPYYEPPAWTLIAFDEAIYVSPFSRSCSSHDGRPPNKMLPFPKWIPILRYLRTLGLPVRLLGGSNDVWEHQQDPVANFTEYEKALGEPLAYVASMLKAAKLLVTIDNGIGHLAASQKTPTVLLYPECLGIHWITHVGNPKSVAIQINPAEVSTTLLLKKIKEVILFDLNIDY